MTTLLRSPGAQRYEPSRVVRSRAWAVAERLLEVSGGLLK